MSALRRMRQTDAEINFKPWIFEIARNAAIDQYRRNTRTDEVSIDVEGGFAPSDVSRVVRPRGPDSSVLDKERLDHLRGALDELSDTHHQIIVMRELEGLSYREIGERMELTPAAVESTLFRARRKLEHEYAAARHRPPLPAHRRRDRAPGRGHRVRARPAPARPSRTPLLELPVRARQLGVEPMLPQRMSIVAKAAALLPLPAFARRRIGGETAGGAAQHAAAPMAAVGAPTLEAGAAMASKAAAVVAAVALVGGGGATLSGVGPLNIEGNGRTVLEKQSPKKAAPESRGSTSVRPGAVRKDGTAAKGADEKAPERAGESSAKRKSDAPSKDKQEPESGIPGLAPGLLTVPSEESPEGEPPPVDEPSSEQPGFEVPSLEPGASAPQVTAPSETDAPGEILSEFGLE